MILTDVRVKTQDSFVSVLRYGPFILINFYVRNSNRRKDQSRRRVWCVSGNY